ncbi:MAG: V-type ATP synthase subunit I [Nanoarchaeota archaeon]
MFRPAKIFHATVIVNEQKVDNLLGKLYELGLCELKEAEADLCSMYSYDLVKSLDDSQNRLNYVINSLEEYKEEMPSKGGFKSLLSPAQPIKHKSNIYSAKDIIEEVNYSLSLIEPKILERVDRLQKINEEIDNNEFIISNLSLLPDIKTDLFKTTENIKVFLGIVKNETLPDIKEQVATKGVIGLQRSGKSQSLVTIFSPLDQANKIERIIHSIGWEVINIPLENKKPNIQIELLVEKIQKLKSEKNRIAAFFARTEKVYQKKFDLLREELEIAKEKIVALQKFKTTETFSVLEAWVPENNLDKLHSLVKESSKQYYIEVLEKDESPTKLQNPKLVEPFEMLTEMYSLPKYKQFDPTPILAITFTIFFGFMLTDFVYGALLASIGYLVYRGVGKYNKIAKQFSILLMMFGISAALIGIVFGSYFGNFFQELGINLPVPIDAMKDVTLTLIIALVIGFVHLSIGLGIGFIENLRQKQIKAGLKGQAVWILFIVSIILFLLKINIIGFVVLGIAVLLQVVLNFIDEGFISSILSVFGFTGFIGDIFSYARLMALAVGTAGIALAVNFMVFMVGSIPWVGWFFAIILFLIGHLFNVAMNGLGAFIHTTRLHFLEFFTKFYEGGGEAYKPFIAQRNNTYIKLEGGK